MLDFLFNYWTGNITSGKSYYNNLIYYIVLPYFVTRLRTSVCLLSVYYGFSIENQVHLWVYFSFSWLNQLKIRKKKRVLRIILTHIHTSSRAYCLSFSFLFCFFSLKRLTICIGNDWFVEANSLLLIMYIKKKGEKWLFFSTVSSRIISITSNKKKEKSFFYNKNKIKKNALLFINAHNSISLSLAIIIEQKILFNKRWLV